MRLNRMNWLRSAVGLAVAIGLASALAAEPGSEENASKGNDAAAKEVAGAAKDGAGSAEGGGAAEGETEEEQVPRLSLDAARERARLMHEIYAVTLDAIHHRYFHGDRAVIPARAMEDVFRDMERKTHTKSRWIGASFTAMSINHEPKTEFEKDAARKIARGQDAVETIEDGYYRRAGSISLNSGCVSCHAGLFAATSPTPKFAGLVISIPVDEQARLDADEASSQTSESTAP